MGGDLKMTWYQKLKFARTILKLTPKDMERLTRIKSRRLIALESGKVPDPKYFEMMGLLACYNLKPAELH
jgi:predicted transcriptional regulator